MRSQQQLREKATSGSLRMNANLFRNERTREPKTMGVRNHYWTQSVQGAVATWSVIAFVFDRVTRSLPLPVLTVSKCDSLLRLLKLE
jgi:hypothetical protein